jgi:hypothetical protein
MIIPVVNAQGATTFRAVACSGQFEGATAGQALDALRDQLADDSSDTLVVVQPLRPDDLFTAEQGIRLTTLMDHWRAARDAGQTLDDAESAELQSLIAAELSAARERAAAMLKGLGA